MYRRIVVGTDGSQTAKRAVDEATQLAKAVGAELHIVSAYEPLRGARIAGAPEHGAEVRSLGADSNVQAVIDEAAAAARIHGVQVRGHALTGDPANALIEVALSEDAEVIVVGSHGMHGVKRMLGSVPNKVSHHARCTVLIVATDGGRPSNGSARGGVGAVDAPSER
jgi:nucleotide-binding universal stress UspA family protein